METRHSVPRTSNPKYTQGAGATTGRSDGSEGGPKTPAARAADRTAKFKSQKATDADESKTRDERFADHLAANEAINQLS
jgi:hypothetical protein